MPFLGDIRELGEGCPKESINLLLRKAAEVCSGVILVGPQMKEFALPVIEKTKTQVSWFPTAHDAAHFPAYQK